MCYASPCQTEVQVAAGGDRGRGSGDLAATPESYRRLCSLVAPSYQDYPPRAKQENVTYPNKKRATRRRGNTPPACA